MKTSRPVSRPQTMEALVRAMITALGEDPDRAGLRQTPSQFVQALRALTSGGRKGARPPGRPKLASRRHQEIIVVRNIPIASLCEHHLLPFFGRCHVGYIPNPQVVRPSTLARRVDDLCRQLQLQERLTSQIATAVWHMTNPRGVGVVIEASHLCMMMRGVQKANAQAVTSLMMGLFKSNPTARSTLMRLIGRQP